MQEVEEDSQQHLHHKRHLKVHELQEPLEEEDNGGEQEETEDQAGEDDEVPPETIEYNYRNHPRHRHQSTHHRHHQRHGHKLSSNEERHADDIDDMETREHRDNAQHHRLHLSTELTTDAVELNLERQEHETKLLQHIVHKLQQEEKQLILLHQQQQQQTQAFDI